MASLPHVWRFCLLVVLALTCVGSSIADDLVITKADKKIDLQTQSARIFLSLKVENKGSKAADSFLFLLPKTQSQNLAFLKAVLVEGRQKSRSFLPLEFSSLPDDFLTQKFNPNFNTNNVSAYSIALPKPLEKSETLNLEMYYVLTNIIRPFPAEITQSDPQLLLFEDSHYYFSSYLVKSQTTTIRLPNSNFESFTKKDPFKQRENEIKFGPFDQVKQFKFSALSVHYENNIPFVKAEFFEREIEISHWGNIYVTENYKLKHVGAKHKGSFSRFDFQSRPVASGVASLRGLIALLPPRAHSVYYRDEIGNISTSHLRSDFMKTEMEMEPRYPLLGGWAVTFTIGYSLPLEDFVFRTKNGFRALNISFGGSFPDIVVDEMIVKVVMPEGSKNLQLKVPFHVDQAEEEKFSYLDTVGRRVMVLKKKNVVSDLNMQYFQVLYSFSAITQFVEPFLLVSASLLFFLLCVVYVRFDFPISRYTPSYLARIQNEEVLNSLQTVQKIFGARNSTLEKLESSLHSLTRTGNIAAAKTARKTFEGSLKDSLKELKTVTDVLEAMERPPSVLPRVQNLLAKERERQTVALQKQQVMVESFERKLSAKEIDQKISSIEKNLVALNSEIKEILMSIEDC